MQEEPTNNQLLENDQAEPVVNNSSEQSPQPNYIIPAAIVVAGLIIAGAIFMGNNTSINQESGLTAGGALGEIGNPNQPSEQDAIAALELINPITADDHIRGNLDATVVLVEYSDFDCPFCQRFHGSLEQAAQHYDDSEFAWVYRHFPLDSIHPDARMIARASECAADTGGAEAFWAFSDRYMQLRSSGDQTAATTLVASIGNEIGLNGQDLLACAQSDRFEQDVQDDSQNARLTGGTGTPWSIAILPGGNYIPLGGALEFSDLQQIIELGLSAPEL